MARSKSIGDGPPGGAHFAECVEAVPTALREVFVEIVALTDRFCQERLNAEYQMMCRELAVALCQPGSPATRGKRESWASGVAYAVGWVNFLGDPSNDPHVRSEDVSAAFGVSMATMQSKSKVLREGLDLIQLDPRFTLPSRLDDNPLVWMMELEGGIIVDARNMPREFLEGAFEAGLIPYVPTDAVEEAAGGVTKESLANGPAYQLKVTLDNVRPPVWRRLLVPDMSLADLHWVLQDAMGWEDEHLHEFSAGKARFPMDDGEDYGPLFGEPSRPESQVTIGQLVAEGHKKLNYWYDFGDDWKHTIQIEKKLAPKPGEQPIQCVAGARACPPEDIGGPWGYAEFLEGLADPDDEERSDWLGGDFDPEEFDLEATNARLNT